MQSKNNLKYYNNFKTMILKIKTLQQLRKIKWITTWDIIKFMTRKTYYNIVYYGKGWRETTKQKLCKLFEIDRATFDKLLKNSIVHK